MIGKWRGTTRFVYGMGRSYAAELTEPRKRGWTLVLVAPRSQLDQLSWREEVRRTGVYLLVGPDPDDPSRAPAYFGEGDNVSKRLLCHKKYEAKDVWERTVVIVGKDENLTKSHVRYLESRLIKPAQEGPHPTSSLYELRVPSTGQRASGIASLVPRASNRRHPRQQAC